MQRRPLFVALTLLALALPALADDPLADGFKTPPKSAQAHTWWHWMNGNVSQAGITADLEAMARVGIGGAQIFNVDQGIPKGNTPYMSPQWRAAVVHAAREAKRLGIELCFHNCAGWSSSGGPWITPAQSMQMLTWSETSNPGGRGVDVVLPEPPRREGYYRDIAVLAIRKPANDTFRIPNIRSKALFDRGPSGLPLGDRWSPGAFAASKDAMVARGQIQVFPPTAPDGRLRIELPVGDWVLVRMGHTSTGAVCAPAPDAGRGLEVDKLSRSAMDAHWAGGIAPILKDLGPLAGDSFNNSLIDSYEVGCQNWTDDFRAQFQKRRGYDPLPWLATVTGRVVESPEASERFLWDLRRTIADLFSENYIGRFKELCHQAGLKFSVEPYGNGPFDNLQVGAQGDIPMGEFWIGGGASETIKIAASSAHVAGKPVVGAESFTADENAGRFQVEPYGIKALGDRIFTLGVNRYIFHRYAHQPWIGVAPGMTMGPWGSHIERTSTWWDQGAASLRYVARCQFLLQSGRFAADVLTFCGDDAPNDLLRPNLPAGFDFDGCDRTVLRTARVERGEIVLPSGMRYRVLVLPDSTWMTPGTLETIAALVRAGATVAGPRPLKSPSLGDGPEGDAKVAALAGELWGGKTGKGRIVSWADLPRVLGAPDVAVPDDAPLVWIHRKLDGDGDAYFVSNQRARRVVSTVRFRVDGAGVELWHPDTGAVEAAPETATVGGKTDVTLRLGPSESVFVVFRKSAARSGLARVARVSGPPSADRAPVLIVTEARYEAVDGAGGADVTEKVRALVARGETDIPATNAVFGDPISLHVKRLRVRYTLDGKPVEKTVGENETLDLSGPGIDYALPEFELDAGRLLAWMPGEYALTDGRGRKRAITAPAGAAQPVTGPWRVTFPPNLGAPPSIELASLVSWPEHPDPRVRYFSGSATYRTTLQVPQSLLAPGRAVLLDLGRVKNFAEVTLNGTPLETLWKPPFRLDVTRLVHPGANTLAVRVTNLWPNRLIGDEQLPDEVEWTGPTGPIKTLPAWLLDGMPRPATQRIAFTTWRFWRKSDTPLESGLIGPVVLRSIPAIPLR